MSETLEGEALAEPKNSARQSSTSEGSAPAEPKIRHARGVPSEKAKKLPLEGEVPAEPKMSAVLNSNMIIANSTVASGLAPDGSLNDRRP